MSSLFSPKIPKAPEPVKPPTIDDTRQAEEELMRLRRRRGRASTFLAGRPRRASSSLLSDSPAPAIGSATANAGGGRAVVPRSATGQLLR